MDFDLGGLLPIQTLVIRLGLATVLGAAIGAERERLERAAGLRTHALVSVASALIMVVSTYGFPLPPNDPDGALDPSRIAAQVVSGIGFLGAGLIVFRENTVRGLTTAASIWSVAGVGLAAGGGLYVPATVGTAFMLLILTGMRPLEHRWFAHYSRQHRVVLWTRHGSDVLGAIQAAIQGAGGAGVRLRSMQLQPASDPDEDVVELVLRAEEQREVLTVVQTLRQTEGVRRLTYRHQRADMLAQEREIDDDEDEDDDDR
jgi:putative Mg2+ transporter-C (MgtC) family protein